MLRAIDDRGARDLNQPRIIWADRSAIAGRKVGNADIKYPRARNSGASNRHVPGPTSGLCSRTSFTAIARPDQVFMLSKKSALFLVERSLSSRNSIASVVPIGARMRRRTYVLAKRALVEQQLVLARAGFEDVDRGIDALVGDLAVENDFRIARALELFEDHFVHAAAGIDQRGRDDGERAAFLDVARRAEEALGALQRVGVDAAGQHLAR